MKPRKKRTYNKKPVEAKLKRAKRFCRSCKKELKVNYFFHTECLARQDSFDDDYIMF